MKEVFNVISPIALIAAIGTALAGAIGFLFSFQLGGRREELRTLRIALEKDPTPSEMGRAATMWPSAGKFGEAMMKSEYIRLAHEEESKRAASHEKLKGLVRTIFFVCAVFAALYVAGIVVKRIPDEAPTPPPTDQTQQ